MSAGNVITVKVNEGGFADRSGWVTPLGTRLAKMDERSGFFVLYIPGHTYYADRMTGQKYAPAEFEVYRLTGENPVVNHERGQHLRGERVLQFPLRTATNRD